MASTWGRAVASCVVASVLALADRSGAAPAQPIGILQATYIGGQQAPVSVRALAVDAANGDVILAGSTLSGDIPGVAGGAQSVYGGAQDGWIARLSADLRMLKQATYLGGTASDEVDAVAIDPSTDDVLVAGFTSSGDLSTTAGGFQPHLAGPSDAFVARLDAGLTTVRQTTYLGGSAAESGPLLGIAVDAKSGDVVVAGSTSSGDFPGTASGAQHACGGTPCADGFVARLKGNLRTLTRATFVGGAGVDDVYDVVVHPLTGDVLVAGDSATTDGSRLVGAVTCYSGDLRTLRGLAHVASTGSHTVAWGLTVDPQLGDVIATGETTGPLEGVANGAQTTPGGGSDAFVVRYDADLFLLQATYLGGSQDDAGVVKPAVRPSTGEVMVAGRTASADFPATQSGAQPALNGTAQDGFVARLTPDLRTLEQATYIGGSAADAVYQIAVRPDSSEVLVAGETSSTDFPATAGGAQPTFDPSGADSTAGFAVRIGAELTGADPTPTASTTPPATATPTATNTPQPGSVCVGDCSGAHRVTVDDLIKGVNIALGNVPIDVCATLDVNGDGRVEVNELISAVANALDGCA
jgi:hypothetical protein